MILSDDVLVPKELTDLILKSYYQVYYDLGSGFLEKVYQNALYYAMIDKGLKCEIEKPINVYHNDRIVGEYRADLLVENCVILELKTCKSIEPIHEAQLLNYLKATNIEVGYILNFGEKPLFCRRIFSNYLK